jgi:hypothetical protein
MDRILLLKLFLVVIFIELGYIVVTSKVQLSSIWLTFKQNLSTRKQPPCGKRKTTTIATLNSPPCMPT